MVEIISAAELRNKIRILTDENNKQLFDEYISKLNYASVDKLLQNIGTKLEASTGYTTLSINVDEVGTNEVAYVKTIVVNKGYVVREIKLEQYEGNIIRWFIAIDELLLPNI